MKTVEVNDNFSLISGFSPEEAIGKTIKDLNMWANPASRVRFLELIEKNGFVHDLEVDVNHKSGIILNGLVSAQVITISEKKYLLGVFNDITERKKIEEKIWSAHQRLTTHLNNSPLAIIEWDKNFVIKNWSVQAKNIFGWEASEAVGKHFNELNLVHEEDGAITAVIAEDLMLGKVKSNRNINRNYTKGNKVIYCEWYNSVLPSADGEIETIFSLVQDVTDRKIVEEKMLKANERNELISSATNDALWDWDLNTNVVWWNKGVTELFGHKLENNEATPDWWLENIHPEEKEKVETFFFNLVNSDINFWEDEYRFKCSDGSYKYVYDRGIVRRDEQGKAFRMLGAMMDTTQRKRIEIELEKHKNNLEELVELRTSELEKEKVKAQSADLMKSAFLATMSHELRTPMNSIIGFTGILLKELAGPLNNEQRRQLGMVKNSGQHLLGLINDVLDISKIEAGKLKVSIYYFNYLTTLEKTIDFLLPQAAKKELQIRSEISELNIILNSDERRVEQVLLNLLSKAIKFSNRKIRRYNTSTK